MPTEAARSPVQATVAPPGIQQPENAQTGPGGPQDAAIALAAAVLAAAGWRVEPPRPPGAPRRPGRPSLVDRALLQQAVDDGLSVRLFAERLGIAQRTVRNTAKREGIVFPDARAHNTGRSFGNPTWQQSPRNQAILATLADGASWQDAARQYGVSRQRIGQIANRAGITRQVGRHVSAELAIRYAAHAKARAARKWLSAYRRALAENKRRTLADKLADLRRRGYSTTEMAKRLKIPPIHASRLIKRYHPELSMPCPRLGPYGHLTTGKRARKKQKRNRT